MVTIYEILQFLLTILRWAIIIQAVLSWLVAFNVVNLSNAFVRQVWEALNTMLEPLYRPIRRILPDFGALDLSPLVVLLLLIMVQSIILPNLFQSLLAG